MNLGPVTWVTMVIQGYVSWSSHMGDNGDPTKRLWSSHVVTMAIQSYEPWSGHMGGNGDLRVSKRKIKLSYEMFKFMMHVAYDEVLMPCYEMVYA